MTKNRWLLLVVCVSFATLMFAGGDAIAAVSGKVVAEKNEFGGKTVETVYPVKDGRKAKIQKDLSFFDAKGKKVKIESTYTEQHTVSTGAEKRITYFDAKGELTRMEKYFVESYAKRKGIDRMVVYYDLNKKKSKTEYYLGSKLIKKTK